MGTLYSISPFTGKTQYDALTESTAAEVGETVNRSAQAGKTWSRLPAAKRAVALRSLAGALETHKDELAQLAHSETALGFDRLVGEIARTCFQLRLFAKELESGNLLTREVDEAVDGPPPAGHPRIVRMYRPLGPVAVFGAGNFPFAFGQLGGDTASALASGCTVVVKDHPGHPQLALRIMEVATQSLSESGFDSDILQSVRGMGAGTALVQHPSIKAAAFTGSQQAGRALWDLATSRPHPIPFYGELGSVNPVFITKAALEERRSELATELASSLTLGLGQFCTKPSIVFLVDDEVFLDELVSAVKQVGGGQLLSPLSLERYLQKVAEVSEVSGVSPLVASEADMTDLSVKPGLLATSVENFWGHAEKILEECFGPLGIIIRCSSESDFERVIENLEGTLVSTIQASPAKDSHLVATLIDQLSDLSGRVVVNGWPTGLAVTPWQHHGGPYPASTSLLHTSVGLQAMMRFVRPFVLQNVTESSWPELS